MQWMIWLWLDFVRSVFWISGALNDMFVSGLSGLASLLFNPQWLRSLQYVYAWFFWFHAFGRCCMFPKSLLITFPLFPHCKLSSKILPVLSKNCIFKPLQVLIRALSPLLNGTLHHRYIVSALKIIIHYNIILSLIHISEPTRPY